MTEQTQNSMVFFIPGIMGSSLRFRGEGEYGQPVDEEIWGGNLWKNIDLLAVNPTRLASPNVEPSDVIREIRTGVWKRFNVYRELLDFCTSKEGLSLLTTQFFPYAYDWRADNRESAKRLASFILSADPSEESRVVIIAHSMGGIVARLMLNENKEIAARTDLLFQIASPIEGSAKAFYTLKKRPKFDRIFDALWSSFHNLKPEKRAQLQATLQGFASLYQLLPPDTITLLLDRSGRQYSALDPRIWHPNLHALVLAAAEVHKSVMLPLQANIKCVYSNSCDTDGLYLVDGLFNIIAEYSVDGDGTVCCSSAFAQTEPSERHLVSGNGSSHNEICHHPSVLELLKGSLQHA